MPLPCKPDQIGRDSWQNIRYNLLNYSRTFMAIKRKHLEKYLRDLLEVNQFNDYGPNGLQVEGKDDINTIAFTVSCSKEAIEEAINKNADCLIAHHGLIWSGQESKTLRGPYAKRLFPLIKNDVNLFAYHLPLDAHIKIGNAAVIAQKLDMIDLQPFALYKGTPTGVKGFFKKSITVTELQNKLAILLNHQVIISSYDSSAKINSLGILTGGASKSWFQAQKEHLDGYLTGEISEHDWHDAREGGIHMFAGGHYATEQFGIQALMDEICQEFKKENPYCFFIPSENPV